ncbi:MerR family transcriptional regulator [Oenococcus oeni]|uniref:MerR family transcriptional regulator n=1 Tax=Oenococcus oeni TaxID=1247 RepID=A0AAQ2UW89_OENOE|nr:MerR family transcriptional regulator [Oenococcus oeni]OIL37178.1 MerR family transcriptional regulator [Oenococcus oeni]OIM23445.1 MerR family transcriptional regulator [Oenococcus oeni]OLQ38143.1 MerR family transcriptional regulator [Oenococcus oeni]SYW06930.1 MerR family transcriptional regulator [Oenococcus oeni]VDB99367.1 MerR family transcriptional regulator [Oenococcus oeni]
MTTYSINALAKLAGVSTRTLRFYDKKGLLRARRDLDNNYRYYDETEVDQLQRIMFLRLFDLPLDQIKKILDKSEAEQYQALNNQRQHIIVERDRLSSLLVNLDKTLATMKGASKMKDTEKFAAFKTKTINDNETQYGKEIRKKYSNSTIDNSNQKFNSLSEIDMTHLQELKNQILTVLKSLIGTHNLNQPAAKQLFELHKEFLLMTWPKEQYSPEAHKSLANMYVSDSRFTKYYEEGTGEKDAAETLKAVIDYYA